MAIDPICGMTVDESSALRAERDGLLISPGETSGWSFGRPTFVLLETDTRAASVLDIVSVS